MRHLNFRAGLFLLLLFPLSAPAQQRGALPDLINAYRAAPGNCQGSPASPAPALEIPPALSRVQVGTGSFLELALERAGYPVETAQAINVSGAANASEVMALITRQYCSALLSTEFSAIGVVRSGDSWLIVLAQPARPPAAALLPDLGDAGKLILDAVNAARARPRSCGERRFAATRPLSWSGTLAGAALAHSVDMSTQRYFSHQGKDGRSVAERATSAGYRWLRIGENIAFGQESAEAVVAGWLSSPGHCVNIMQPDFTDMGAAYAIDSTRKVPRIYWTQVFGTPR